MNAANILEWVHYIIKSFSSINATIDVMVSTYKKCERDKYHYFEIFGKIINNMAVYIIDWNSRKGAIMKTKRLFFLRVSWWKELFKSELDVINLTKCYSTKMSYKENIRDYIRKIQRLITVRQKENSLFIKNNCHVKFKRPIILGCV